MRGMDADLVESIAEEIRLRTEYVSEIITRSGVLIRRSEALWFGSNSRRWLESWDEREAGVRQMADFLQCLASELRRNLEEQRRISEEKHL